MGAGDGNEAGHWEASSVVSLNDQMFASAGSQWNDWGPLNDDWRRSSLRDDMLQKASMIIEEHAGLGPLFVIKDPRLCRLADVWLAAMAKAKVDSSAVMMVRNPAEVIASLESRDLMAPEYSQLLWLRHTLDAEFFSRGRNRVVCRYDQLMSNWCSVIDRVRIGLGITLPRNSASVHVEIEQFLDRKHVHHEMPLQAVIGNPALSDWLRTTFTIMIKWSEEGENPSDYIELDQIRTDFDRSYSTFARLMLPGELAGEAGLGYRVKRELEAEVIAAQTASREAEARVSAAAVRESELAAEIARLEAATSAANSDVERETRHREAIEVELNKITEKARKHELLNAELSSRLAVAESTIAQRQEELSQLMTQFLETERLSARAIAKEAVVHEQLISTNAALEQDVSKFNERITSLTSIRTKLQSDLNERNAELARITAILASSEDIGRASAEHFSWLQAVHSVLSKEPRFARLRTRQFVKKWRYNELRRLGLFDPDVYLEMNPDVRAEGMDPLHHYVLHGLLENRSSGV
jgi:hypothetical protein